MEEQTLAHPTAFGDIADEHTWRMYYAYLAAMNDREDENWEPADGSGGDPPLPLPALKCMCSYCYTRICGRPLQVNDVDV